MVLHVLQFPPKRDLRCASTCGPAVCISISLYNQNVVDFTLKTYKRLLNALSDQGFSFLTFAEFLSKASNKAIVLRHDVDALPGNSLEFARIQAELGIKGSYYFRVVPGSWDEDVIKEIAGMGHEVGYHYEDLSLALAKLKAQGAGRQGKGRRDEETRDKDSGLQGAGRRIS